MRLGADKKNMALDMAEKLDPIQTPPFTPKATSPEKIDTMTFGANNVCPAKVPLKSTGNRNCLYNR